MPGASPGGEIRSEADVGEDEDDDRNRHADEDELPGDGDQAEGHRATRNADVVLSDPRDDSEDDGEKPESHVEEGDPVIGRLQL